MTRTSLAIVAGVVTVGSIAPQAAAHPSIVRAGLSNLVLYAFGTHPVPTGSIRIPIVTADATYEAIVKEPGVPTLDHLDARIGQGR